MRAVAMILLAPLLAGCGAEERASDADAGPPVLVLAVDGFEWSVALPLLHEGRMPALAGLMERGSYGTLKPMRPSKSPRLWTTIATGKPPSEHGIMDFTREGPEGEELLYTSADRRVKAFWNILSDHDVSSDTLGWWITWPVEPVVGIMVAQTNTDATQQVYKGSLVEGLERQVWPPDQEARTFSALERAGERLDAHLDAIFGTGLRKRLPQVLRDAWDECRWSLQADLTYLEILRDRLARGEHSRVTALYVGGTDVLGHRFWTGYEPEAFEPRPDPRETELVGHVIPAYYEYVDDVLAELLEAFPADATIFVVADHGMRAGVHHGGEPGMFVVAGPGLRASGTTAADVRAEDIPELGRLVDVCPTLLALVGVPYGEDMLGRPLEDLFDDLPAAASVPTHDDPAWLEERSGELLLQDPARLEQLRQLGYLGEDG